MNHSFRLAALALLLVASLPVSLLNADDEVASDNSTASTNKAVVSRFVETVLNRGEYDQTATFVDAAYRDNNAQGAQKGPAMVADTERFRRLVFPDLSFEVEDLMAEGDRVMVRLRLRGTHSGKAMGVEPTGGNLDMRAVRIYRLDEGKMVEGWAMSDMIELYRATGHTVSPPSPATEATFEEEPPAAAISHGRR